MYGKIVENTVETVAELPREIVVGDRHIFNPSMGDCGLVELPIPAPEEGFRFTGYVVQDGEITCAYEEIPEPVVEVVEEEEVENEGVDESEIFHNDGADGESNPTME